MKLKLVHRCFCFILFPLAIFSFDLKFENKKTTNQLCEILNNHKPVSLLGIGLFDGSYFLVTVDLMIYQFMFHHIIKGNSHHIEVKVIDASYMENKWPLLYRSIHVNGTKVLSMYTIYNKETMWVIDLENIDKSRSTMLYTLYDNSIKEVDENPYNMIDDLHDVSYRFMSTYQAKTVMIQLLDNNNQLYKTIIAETLYNEKRNYHLKKNKTLQICELNNGTEVVLHTDERKECKMIQFPKQSQLMTGFINENGQMFLMSNDNVWIILSNEKALKFQENSNKSFRLFQKSLEQFFSCDTNGKMTTTEGIRIFFYASTIIVVILIILVLFLFIYTSPILKNNTRHGGTSPSRTEKIEKKGKNEKEVKQNYDQITTIPQQKKEVSSKRLLNVNGKEHPTNESNGQLKEAKQKNMTNNMKNKLSSAKNRIVDQSHSISKTRRLPVTTDSRSIVSNSKKNVSNRKTRSRKISGKVALKSAKTRKNKNVSGGKIVDGQRSRSLRKSTKMAVESKRKTIKEGSDPLVNDSSNASSNLSN